MSHFLTYERALQAVRETDSQIQELIGSEKTDGLHIVIMDPALPMGRRQDQLHDFETAILVEVSYGDKAQWSHPYDEIARQKAFVTWRTGLSSRTVKENAPWLYIGGDTRYIGSLVENGLIVAASGFEENEDELVCRLVLTACQHLCLAAMSELAPDAPAFFPTVEQLRLTAKNSR
jgi:hypothetical protein